MNDMKRYRNAEKIVRDYYSNTALKSYRKKTWATHNPGCQKRAESDLEQSRCTNRESKAGSETLYRLSRVLGVPMELLLEK